MTRIVEWTEPYFGDGKTAVICRMTVDDVIHFQMARIDCVYTDPQRALDDFVTVHWAEIKNADVPDWQSCAQAILNEPRVLHITRAHASAEPKPLNLAWVQTHNDLGCVLRMLERCARGEFAPRREG